MIRNFWKERVVGSCLMAILFSVTFFSSGSAGDLSIDGYLKNFSVVYEFPDFKLDRLSIDPPPMGAVSNRLRLDVRWRVNRWMSASAAYDLVPRVQDLALFATDAITDGVYEDYRIDDLDSRIYPDENDPVSSFGLYQNLDRLLLEIRLGLLDLYIGRQAIAWGSARVINPTDILAPFSYTSLDTEDRVGVDGLRVRVPLGIMSELDAGLVAGENFESANSAAYLRYKTNLLESDLAGIVVGFREHLLIGFEVARSVGGEGVWLEAAHVWPELLQPDADLRPDGYWRMSVGVDRSLGANTYGFAEYHYNQPGSSYPCQYLALISSDPYVDGAVYLLGEHYLIPGVSHQISPLIGVTGEILWNLPDGSACVALSLECSLAEDVYLSGGGFVGIGSGPDRWGQLKSEFGAYPDMFYSSFRYYF